MNRTQVKLAIAGAVVATVALAVGLTLWLADGGTKAPISHEAYIRLWESTVPGDAEANVLDEWPKPPYQDYSDGFQNRCYEWLDKTLHTTALYNLCFKDGKLVSKNIA